MSKMQFWDTEEKTFRMRIVYDERIVGLRIEGEIYHNWDECAPQETRGCVPYYKDDWGIETYTCATCKRSLIVPTDEEEESNA